MLEASARRILDRLADDDLILDVGGWGRPFTRADWVIDLMPHETRGRFGRDGEAPERFSAETWVRRDVCDPEPWPFEDGKFDFVVCSQTLEDLRDPLWVCAEMIRVGKAGYIEAPSRLEEQSYGFQGPWVGWGHHRWLIDVGEGHIEFVFKHHVIHSRSPDHFPRGFRDKLSPAERVQALWWEGSFDYGERIMLSAEELDPYLSSYVARELEQRGIRQRWSMRERFWTMRDRARRLRERVS